ncbi:MAG: hypothetical protein ABL904_02105 [Hyphomicrobiaceae bacterium]
MATWPPVRALSLMDGRHGDTLGARIDPTPAQTMRDTQLVQPGLGINSPWFVATSNFEGEKKRLDIEVDFKSGARLPCPDCKAADCPVHDTARKSWRHLRGGRRSIRHSTRCFTASTPTAPRWMASRTAAAASSMANVSIRRRTWDA